MPRFPASAESGTGSVSTAGHSRRSLIRFPIFSLKLSLSNEVFKIQSSVVVDKRMYKERKIIVGDRILLKGPRLTWRAVKTQLNKTLKCIQQKQIYNCFYPEGQTC